MSTEHLGNEEGCRNNDDNNLSFADTWYEQGKKKSPQVFCATGTPMVRSNYFTTLILYSLFFYSLDLDPQIVASFKAAILILFSKSLFLQVGVIFYFSLACKWQIVTFLLQRSFVSEKT